MILASLQGTEIRYEATLALDGEDGVARRQANITRTDEVNAGADAVTVHGGNHRKWQFVERRDRVLHDAYVVVRDAVVAP